MREVASDVRRWFDEGRAVALAQVTKTWGSSPRVPGSVMAVADDGRLAGSVSGGCIEGAVAQVAMECAGSRLSSLEKFHASTRRAQEVGLSCGGNIEVFVGDLPRALFAVEEALIRADAAYARVTAVEAVFPGDRVDDPSQDDAAVREGGMDALGAMAIVADEEALTAAVASLAPAVAAEVAVARCDGAAVATAGEADCLLAVAEAVAARPASEDAGHVIEGGIDWFFARVRPAPQLVCIGGVHIAMRLAEIAHVMGFRTVVVGTAPGLRHRRALPRGGRARARLAPGGLRRGWPGAPYGQHGGLRPHPRPEDRRAGPSGGLGLAGVLYRLFGPFHHPALPLPSAGGGGDVPDEQIARIYGPIGLDLRGREPAEIALSIMAEICAVRHGSPYELSTMLETARGLEGGEAA